MGSIYLLLVVGSSEIGKQDKRALPFIVAS